VGVDVLRIMCTKTAQDLMFCRATGKAKTV